MSKRPQKRKRIKREKRNNRIGKAVSITLVSALTLTLGACSSSESALPDLSGLGEITVVTREEGSGTRSEFESLVDTTGEGANEMALSTDEVLELVAGDTNAIGYVAYSALAELEGEDGGVEGITILTVDGVSCNADTIADGDYSLEREYILAYIGELSELETDFITYIRSAGQEIVAGIATPVRETKVFLSGGESGTITIAGSSSMETLMEALIADYSTYNPNAEIILKISDSTEGLNAAMRGECDLAMSSRSLASYEEEILDYYVIAADGIALIVNAENPLTDLSISRLKTIYDGSVNDWGDLE